MMVAKFSSYCREMEIWSSIEGVDWGHYEQANVTVTASAADLPGWLWALKPTIERVMIWQARKSGRAFLTFCEDRANAYVAERKGGKVKLQVHFPVTFRCAEALPSLAKYEKILLESGSFVILLKLHSRVSSSLTGDLKTTFTSQQLPIGLCGLSSGCTNDVLYMKSRVGFGNKLRIGVPS